jgi:hypothetical protein
MDRSREENEAAHAETRTLIRAVYRNLDRRLRRRHA